MASRFGVDISDVGRGFQDLVQSWNLVGEQRRVQAEREAQSDQALLSLALAAGGAFIPGVSAVAGAQMGLGAAQLLGPRPNVGAGAPKLLGGADRMQRGETPGEVCKALNPANRGAAAQAAANLGDIGTAAGLAFPGESDSGRDPQLYEVRIPSKEPDGEPKIVSGLTLAAMQAQMQNNPDARAAKMPTGFKEGEEAKGSPRQVWINSGSTDNPKWQARTVTNNAAFESLQEKKGPENVLLQDPTAAKGERSTEFERMGEFIISLGEKRREGASISDEDLSRENLYRQRLSRPVSFVDPVRGPVTQPGLSFEELDKLGNRAAEGSPATAPAGTAPLPIPKRRADIAATTEKTRTEAQRVVVAAREQRARLSQIRETFKPEYLQWSTQAWVGGLKVAEKLGVPLSDDQRANISNITTFKQRSIENLNLYIKEITGAQMSEAEAGRLRRAMPDI